MLTHSNVVHLALDVIGKIGETDATVTILVGSIDQSSQLLVGQSLAKTRHHYAELSRSHEAIFVFIEDLNTNKTGHLWETNTSKHGHKHCV